MTVAPVCSDRDPSLASAVAQTSSSTSSGAAAGGGGGGSGGASSTVPVTIRLQGHHLGAGLDQAAVSFNFTQAKAKHELSVPVTALIATSGGNHAGPGSGRAVHDAAGQNGLFAAGLAR